MDASTRTEITGDAGLPTHLLLTAEQAAASLAICRTKVYELLRNGQLESIRIGTSRRIPTSALAEYVERIRDAQRLDSEISCTSDPGGRPFSKMGTMPGSSSREARQK
jgi:excisionase family DNA binding protein